ncbi:MAG: DUF2889 domain-containing protein, partial [Desulfocucumaceae bacterium]
MKILSNSHWHTSIQIAGPEIIIGRTDFISTDSECSATIQVNRKTFLIESARWEVYRGQEDNVSKDILSLKGVEAYLGSGGALRNALTAETLGANPLSLFSETVRGIIQSETFLYRERGFADTNSYDEFWNSMYLNTCRYYSNLERITVKWEDHISGQRRYDRLYNKFKTVTVSEDGDSLKASAVMSDSFHELGISIVLEKESGGLTDVYCSLLRAPDKVCFEAADFSKKLLGEKIAAMSKKEIAIALGSSQGCVHIIDTW